MEMSGPIIEFYGWLVWKNKWLKRLVRV